MIHIDKNGNVIGSFDAPQGHGMDVDSKGFVYIGQDTVRKYDPKTGKVVGEVPRAPERQPGGGGGGGARLRPAFRVVAALAPREHFHNPPEVARPMRTPRPAPRQLPRIARNTRRRRR